MVVYIGRESVVSSGHKPNGDDGGYRLALPLGSRRARNWLMLQFSSSEWS